MEIIEDRHARKATVIASQFQYQIGTILLEMKQLPIPI